jgi:iduronate 2-sulfatase|tara:strand:+ start:1219 stop:2685 length:1467 start_codon:yes stop_codon:yes gene_type:complete
MMKLLKIGLFLKIALGAFAFASEKPNVLFIMTDDLNCDLGSYGHPLVKSPNIDRLASQGVLFENAYCNYPVCGPSRASFMTGLYPEQNGVTVLRRLFRNYVPDAVTLSQHFMRSGYTAARVGKIYHYDNPKGVGTDGHDDPASWNTKINPRGRDKDEEDKIFSLRPGSFGASLSWLAAEGTDEEQTDGKVATESIGLLKQYADNDTPFFLAVGFYKPHTPYVAPKKYFDLYDSSQITVPTIPEGYLDTLPGPAKKTVTAFKLQIDLPEETARKAMHAYYATISFVDAQIGRLLDSLDELGLRDDTIVLFSSDHGYHMGEHGHFQKNTLFENADRVPLILSAPGMKEVGKRSQSFAEMIDFYRTLSDLAGLPKPPEYVKGVSLRPVLQNVSKAPRSNSFTQLINGYTLRTRDFRITKWKEGSPDNLELYDQRNDPEELVNLAKNPEYRKDLAKLVKLLDGRIADATARPEGLSFTAPDPKDRGVQKTYE